MSIAIDKNSPKLPNFSDCYFTNAVRMDDESQPVFPDATHCIVDSSDSYYSDRKIFDKITMVNGYPKLWEDGETASTEGCAVVIHDCEQLIWALCGYPRNFLPSGYNKIYFLLDPTKHLTDSQDSPVGFWFQKHKYFKTGLFPSSTYLGLCGGQSRGNSQSTYCRYYYMPINPQDEIIIQGLQYTGSTVSGHGLFESSSWWAENWFERIYFKDWLYIGGLTTQGLRNSLFALYQSNSDYLFNFNLCKISLGIKSSIPVRFIDFSENYTSKIPVVWTDCARTFNFYHMADKTNERYIFHDYTERCTTKIINASFVSEYPSTSINAPLISYSKNSSWYFKMDYYGCTTDSRTIYLMQSSYINNVFLYVEFEHLASGANPRYDCVNCGGSNIVVFDCKEEGATVSVDATVKRLDKSDAQSVEKLNKYGFFVEVV